MGILTHLPSAALFGLAFRSPTLTLIRLALIRKPFGLRRGFAPLSLLIPLCICFFHVPQQGSSLIFDAHEKFYHVFMTSTASADRLRPIIIHARSFSTSELLRTFKMNGCFQPTS